jgi:branched-chain amino acid transport system ATP-binding protein
MSALRIEDLSLRFGGVQALANVSLEVQPGERRLIIGPNGAGKTTLFNVITGLIRAASGRIALFGSNIERLAVHERARLGIARTFQVTNLFRGLSAIENMMLALQARERVGIVLNRPMTAYAQLRNEALEFLDSWGLSADASRAVRDLSYGAQREIDLMLALIGRPRLLLLDEPLSGLSAVESARVVKIIHELPRDITILLIEHDMNVALDLADRITVLHQGDVIAEGDRQTVCADPKVNDIYLGTE